MLYSFSFHTTAVFSFFFFFRGVQLDLHPVLTALYFPEWLKGATYFLVFGFFSNVASYLPKLPDRLNVPCDEIVWSPSFVPKMQTVLTSLSVRVVRKA